MWGCGVPVLDRIMSYRRGSEGPRAWQEWLDQHRHTLNTCSLPEFVFSDKLTWLRFLEHGGWHPQPGWGVVMLSPNEARKLHEFIESQYGPDEYRSLLRNLENARRKPST
jgi:hypothetical protein